MEFLPDCLIRHFFLIPLRWRISKILLYLFNMVKSMAKKLVYYDKLVYMQYLKISKKQIYIWLKV